mgnify:CR=1 FL=1
MYLLFFNSNTKIKNFDDKNLHFHLINKLSKFIDFDFKLSERKNYDLGDRKVNFEKFSNKILKYRYYLEQDNEYVYLIN